MRVLPLVAVLAVVAAAGEFEMLGDGRFRLGGEVGTLRQKPVRAHVLEERPAAVLFDNHDRPGHGDAVAFVEKGAYVWHRSLKELFDDETVRGFFRTLDGIHWNRAHWVDEPRRRIVLVTTSGQVCELGQGFPQCIQFRCIL